MLAYIFWHRPDADADVDEYEQALLGFHHSLTRLPPVGLRGSATFRVPDLPWPAPQRAGYEDWYVLEDFGALGVLNEAAVGRGHRTPHDRAARHYGAGAGALYALLEGEPDLRGAGGERCDATWVTPAPHSRDLGLAELLGDGMGVGGERVQGSLWRRLLVLGPAPEYCLIAREATAGVAATRLPEGWSARTLERVALFAC